MYVCLCKSVSDKDIVSSVEQGARSWREVQRDTGCGTQCGKCVCLGKQLTREVVSELMALEREGLAYAV